jgi:hypothetical protein
VLNGGLDKAQRGDLSTDSVLAYFDATGQDDAPNDYPSTVSTRARYGDIRRKKVTIRTL